jgi:hypothetical protein
MSAGARLSIQQSIGHGAEKAWAKLPATLVPWPAGIISVDSQGVVFNRFVIEHEAVLEWVLKHDVLFCHACRNAVHDKPIEALCECGGIICLKCWEPVLRCPSRKQGGK